MYVIITDVMLTCGSGNISFAIVKSLICFTEMEFVIDRLV